MNNKNILSSPAASEEHLFNRKRSKLKGRIKNIYRYKFYFALQNLALWVRSPTSP